MKNIVSLSRTLTIGRCNAAPKVSCLDSAPVPRRRFPNGLETDLSFEAQTGRLASLAHRPRPAGNPLLKFDHAYDLRGNLSALAELSGTKTFSYDAVERLTGANLVAPPQQIESYSYDPEGNRIASHISASYAVDNADRVLENADGRYDWSADGQLTKRTPKNGGVAWSFVSSFRARTNQMRLDAALGSDGTTISFVYDPFGRLVSPQWPAPRGNEELYYDGPDVVLARRRLASGDQWVRSVHGPLDDQPLATEVYAQGAAPTPGTGSQFYYHADGEGSIRLITNAGSTVFNRYDYDSFGRRLAVVESLPFQPYGWKGREWIAGPDIYYNRARFYDPALGRFLAEDPLGYGGGDSNLYSFAWNNPKNWSDPSGLSASESGILSQVTPIAAAAAVGCAVSTTFSELAAWLSGDANNEVVGLNSEQLRVSFPPSCSAGRARGEVPAWVRAQAPRLEVLPGTAPPISNAICRIGSKTHVALQNNAMALLIRQ